MPFYEFECEDCSHVYEELTSYDEKGLYEGIVCPKCNSCKKIKLASVPSIQFADPTTSSKFDSFTYRAGHLMAKAQDERRNAEEKSHMGGTEEIYGPDEPFDNMEFI